MSKPALFPDGHFYSPVVDTNEVLSDQLRIWHGKTSVPGIDLREDRHRALLTEHFPELLRDYDYPLEGPEDEELSFYYEHNSQFRWMDSRSLFCLLRMIRPNRLIEVGSGYSSLLIDDVNTRFLDRKLRLTCIEPYPRPFLENGSQAGSYELIRQRVQEVGAAVFSELEAGDVLFIDSSHVCKTGSDVTHLILNILPVLAPGVYVHIHDIFLPDDYPREWVVDENRCWNEQYLLQALLVDNPGFEVVFGSSYAFLRLPDLVSSATGLPPFGGGSFWIRRTYPHDQVAAAASATHGAI